jgi:hypothetical protein
MRKGLSFCPLPGDAPVPASHTIPTGPPQKVCPFVHFRICLPKKVHSGGKEESACLASAPPGDERDRKGPNWKRSSLLPATLLPLSSLPCPSRPFLSLWSLWSLWSLPVPLVHFPVPASHTIPTGPPQKVCPFVHFRSSGRRLPIPFVYPLRDPDLPIPTINSRDSLFYIVSACHSGF